jgi:thymidylate synthase (FAD)
MKLVKPEVRLIARPDIDWQALSDYILSMGGDSEEDPFVHDKWSEWSVRRLSESAPDAEILVEAAGRACYRSWQPGLNPNVTKVREDRAEYLANILSSGHGSVLEHANFTFTLHHISRIVSHELVRHRAGTAISQESMRYVRLDDIPVWFPDWAREDAELMRAADALVYHMECFQNWARHFKLDEPGTPFHEKKHKTSFMRRFAPSGHATEMVWTANVRALRHVIALRTDPAAEEEIRIVAGKLGRLMRREVPALFGDFEVTDGAWVPKNAKV